MKKISIFACICFCMVFAGCRTVSSRYEMLNGQLTEVERLELRGVGKNKADFKDKNISNDSGIKIPELTLPKLELN